MRKRFLYSLLFGIPGFFIAGTISLLFFGSTLGVLWLFVFGDNSWPSSTETVISFLFLLVFLLIWIVFVVTGFIIGKRLEEDPALNKKHILVSGVLTLVLVLLIVLQQFSVGNFGPKSADVVCSDFCRQQGYSASGLPPKDSGDRSCTCYDDLGNEAQKFPLDSLNTNTSK